MTDIQIATADGTGKVLEADKFSLRAPICGGKIRRKCFLLTPRYDK